MSLMNIPARRANWGPGPLMTLQVHVSQCQHRQLPQTQLKKTQTWEEQVTSPSITHLGGLVYVAENSLRNRSLPNTWLTMKIFRSEGKIGLYSHPHTKLDQNPQVFYWAFSPHPQYILRIYSAGPQLTISCGGEREVLNKKRLK